MRVHKKPGKGADIVCVDLRGELTTPELAKHLTHTDSYFGEDVEARKQRDAGEEQLARISAQLLSRLPELNRRCIELVKMQNLSKRAAARQLGVHRRTVTIKLDEGLEMLREALVDALNELEDGTSNTCPNSENGI